MVRCSGALRGSGWVIAVAGLLACSGQTSASPQGDQPDASEQDASEQDASEQDAGLGPEQQVQNGDFAGGLGHWLTFAQHGGALTLAVDAGELAVNVTALGADLTDVQVKSDGGLNLVAGHSYRFSFDAYADSPRTVDTSVWENGRDLDGDGFLWSTYQYDRQPLTTSMSTFSVDFTMPLTNDNAGVCFFVGGSTGVLYLDNITLTELP